MSLRDVYFGQLNYLWRRTGHQICSATSFSSTTTFCSFCPSSPESLFLRTIYWFPHLSMFSVLVAVSLLFASLPACLASNHKTGLHHHAGSLRAATHHNYARAHSLGDSYQFDARDGWQTVNISNTAYANQSPHPTPSTPKTAEKKRDTGLTGAVEKVVNGVWEGLKALGGTTPVTITW